MDYAKNCRLFTLPNSYRFGVRIGDTATALIRHNVARIDNAIHAIASGAGTVTVVRGAQYSDLATMIKADMEERNYAPESICVLSRRHADLIQLEQELIVAKVPCARIGRYDDIRKTWQFRAVMGYMRLSVNPRDRRAFMAITGPEKLDALKIVELRAKALNERKPLSEAYGHVLPARLDDVASYLELYDEDHYYTEAVDYIRSVIEAQGISETDDLVRYLAIESAQDRIKGVEDKVLLCTSFCAKGLEWPVVYVVGVNADRFPSSRAIKEGREEEERRVFYVSITRAEERLYIVSSASEEKKKLTDSKFLSEIGSDYDESEKPDVFGGDDLVM